MRNQILIYKDYGCADTTILEQELRAYFIPKKCKIDLVDATSIIKDNALNQNVLAFFMPGGASTPYRHKLETLGNDKIRRYIQNGGIYYGICAGAYYACRQTEFEKDIPESSIVEEYKLDLIDAKAIGTLYKELGIEPFSKKPTSSAAVELLDNEGNIITTHYHGGPYFELAQTENIEVLARYNLQEFKPAVISCSYGRGKVILSGVHYEDSGDVLAKVISNTFQTAQILQKNEASRRLFFNKLMSLTGK